MIYFTYNADKLPLITLTGKADIPAPNCHFSRTPHEYILYFVTSGTMKLTEGTDSYTLNKGDCLILDPSRAHSGLPTDSAVSYYYVHFLSGHIQEITADSAYIENHQISSRIDTAATEQLLIPKNIHFSEVHYSYVESLLEKLCFGKEQLYRKTICECLLLELLILCAQSGQTLAEKLPSAGSSLVPQLIDYIYENCHHKITSTDIEAHFHMNFDYLNRQFKKKTGMTLIHFSNRYRISESKKLLKSGLYSVSEVAWMMGFSNEFYFSRIYKKFEGVAPSFPTQS